MKKTLVALAVAAFASSASALTVYEKDGSKVDFEGSIRLRLEQNSTKYKYKDVAETKKSADKRAHSNLHNDGTRFQIKAKHELSEDLFAVGRLEFRFNGSPKNTDQFGELYANRAYVGLGSKTFGTVTFGRQETIGDDIAQAGFDKAYGVFDTTLTTSGKAVIRYDYTGVEGLQVGLGYRFAEDRTSKDSLEVEKKALEDAVSKAQLALLAAKAKEVTSTYPQANKDADVANAQTSFEKAQNASASGVLGEIPNGKLKNGYDFGVVYTFDVADAQSVTVATGYSRDNFVSATSRRAHKDAWASGVSYKVQDLTLAADYAGNFARAEDAKTSRFNGFRVGAKYQVTPAVAVYTNYGHRVEKAKDAKGMTAKKTVGDKFMLGSSYQVHKSVFTYVEGGFVKEKITEGKAVTRKTDKNIGVGLRVFW